MMSTTTTTTTEPPLKRYYVYYDGMYEHGDILMGYLRGTPLVAYDPDEWYEAPTILDALVAAGALTESQKAAAVPSRVDPDHCAVWEGHEGYVALSERIIGSLKEMPWQPAPLNR